MTVQPYKATLVVDVDVYAGIPGNYDDGIKDHVMSRLCHSFFVVARNVQVAYPEEKKVDEPISPMLLNR